MAEGDTQATPETGTVEAAAGDATQQTEQADGGTTETQQTDQGGEQGTPQAATEPPAQPTLTPEQIEERTFQRLASWYGRRDKESREAIIQNVRQMLEQRIPSQQPAPTPVFDGKIDTAALLEKPAEVLNQFGQSILSQIPKVLGETQQRQAQAEKQFVTDTVTHAGQIMDGDPLFSGEEGAKLGNEVAQEILRSTNNLDRNLAPNLAARLAVSEAVAAVVRKRSNVKANAFAGKQPMGKGQGTLSSPTPQVNKPAPIKLDPVAAQVAAMFGNSDEEIQKFLGSKK